MSDKNLEEQLHVYVVYFNDWEGSFLDAIFRTKEAADTYAAEKNTQDKAWQGYSVEEEEVRG